MVVLPVESQKRLVQILHFLPAFPAELLACLSQVCNTGRVSASLATTLIRTIHLRYEGYDTSACTNAVLESASSVPLWDILKCFSKVLETNSTMSLHNQLFFYVEFITTFPSLNEIHMC